MSLGCARCGDCCTAIHLSLEVAENLDELRAGKALPEGADPSYLFIVEHWTETSRDEDGALFECGRFDAVTRLCMAHEGRPPVCVGFPFYEGAPIPNAGEATPERVARMPLRCSYALDVPVADRREGARPLIPLSVVARTTEPPRTDHGAALGAAGEVSR